MLPQNSLHVFGIAQNPDGSLSFRRKRFPSPKRFHVSKDLGVKRKALWFWGISGLIVLLMLLIAAIVTGRLNWLVLENEKPLVFVTVFGIAIWVATLEHLSLPREIIIDSDSQMVKIIPGSEIPFAKLGGVHVVRQRQEGKNGVSTFYHVYLRVANERLTLATFDNAATAKQLETAVARIVAKPDGNQERSLTSA